MNHPVHKNLRAAYSFYNVATSTSMQTLVNDMLTVAKQVAATFSTLLSYISLVFPLGLPWMAKCHAEQQSVLDSDL